MKSINHEAPQYVILSSLPLLCFSFVQIFSSELSSSVFTLAEVTVFPRQGGYLIALHCVYPTLALSRAQLN